MRSRVVHKGNDKTNRKMPLGNKGDQEIPVSPIRPTWPPRRQGLGDLSLSRERRR